MTRIPEVGDLVHIGYKRLPRDGSGLGVFPAIVLVVETPGDPMSTLTLSVLRPNGTNVARGTKYAGDLTEDRWSWPGPRADGRPR